MLLTLLAEAPVLQIDTVAAGLIASGLTGAGGVVAGGIIKGATLVVRYLARRDKVHDESMTTSMETLLEIQRETIETVKNVTVSVGKVTEAVSKLERDFETDRRHRPR
jgi:hypothetical protein